MYYLALSDYGLLTQMTRAYCRLVRSVGMTTLRNTQLTEAP